MTTHSTNQDAFAHGVPNRLVHQVRTFIQDFAPVNELFQGEESSDALIARAIVDTLADWNYTPPVLNYRITPTDLITQEQYAGVRRAVIDMAGARVLRIISIKHARQDIPYTAGNVNVQPHAVWRNIEGIFASIRAEYESVKKDLKVAENCRGGWTYGNTEMYDGLDDGIDAL